MNVEPPPPATTSGFACPASPVFWAIPTRFNSGSNALRDPCRLMRLFAICSRASSISGRFANACITRSCTGRTSSVAGTSFGVVATMRASRSTGSAVPRRVITVFMINSCCSSNPSELARSCRLAATCACARTSSMGASVPCSTLVRLSA